MCFWIAIQKKKSQSYFVAFSGSPALFSLFWSPRSSGYDVFILRKSINKSPLWDFVFYERVWINEDHTLTFIFTFIDSLTFSFGEKAIQLPQGLCTDFFLFFFKKANKNTSQFQLTGVRPYATDWILSFYYDQVWLYINTGSDCIIMIRSDCSLTLKSNSVLKLRSNFTAMISSNLILKKKKATSFGIKRNKTSATLELFSPWFQCFTFICISNISIMNHVPPWSSEKNTTFPENTMSGSFSLSSTACNHV